METVTHPAVELYAMATGEALDPSAAEALRRLLATGPDGKWTSREAFVNDRRVLDARALAGLFLLGEDVMWSFQRAVALRDTFNRMVALIDGAETLASEVARIRRSNGAERIDLRSGRRLMFACRNYGRGIRGASVDCHLFDEALAGPASTRPEERAIAFLLGTARPNPQLVSCA